VQPGYENARQNRAAALRALRRPVEAAASKPDPEVSKALPAGPKAGSAAPTVVKKVNAREAEALHKRARQLMERGDYAQALPALSDALALDPKHVLAWNARGYCYLMLRKYIEAIADFEEAVRLRPDYANAIANREAARRALKLQ